MTDRIAQNQDAERSVLSGCLLDNDLIADVAAGLEPSHFAGAAHAQVYAAILAIAGRQEPVDRVTLKAELTTRGAFDAVGGDDLVDSLDKYAPSSGNLGYYAGIVREAATFRGVQSAASEAVQIAREGLGTSAELLDRLEGKISALRFTASTREAVTAGAAIRSAFKTMEARHARGEDVTGVPTGLRSLDLKTTGFQPGELVILAARPSMGKTAAALGWAIHVALEHKRDGRPSTVAFFSLEMPVEQLTERMLAHEARVDHQRIRVGGCLESDWSKLALAAGRLGESALLMDDTASIGALEVRAKARRIASKAAAAGAPLRLVVVDYLQLMRGNPAIESREQQVAEIGWALKSLARELRIPVVALCQLNRSVEKRKDGRPILSDLRESGALEQHADVVLFVHRQGLVDKAVDPSEAEIIIGKQRNGPVCVVPVEYRGEWTRFLDPQANAKGHWQDNSEAA